MSLARLLRGTVAASALLLVGALPLAAAPILASPESEAQAEAVAPAQRSMGLAHAPNSRDIGGYSVQRNRNTKVKMGVVYRADSFGKLDAGEQQKLLQLNIGKVIDFRSPAEVYREPDKLPAGITRVEHQVFDPSNDFFVFLGTVIQGGPEKQQEVLGGGKGAEIMRNFYRFFVENDTARAQFAATIQDIVDAPGPIVYHCTSGKDRTGWMTAILLQALGVARPVINQDFMESHENLTASNNALLDQLVAQGLVKDRRLFLPLLDVQPDFLTAAFQKADEIFGSFDNFLSQGLGVDSATLDALKAKLLTQS